MKGNSSHHPLGRERVSSVYSYHTGLVPVHLSKQNTSSTRIRPFQFERFIARTDTPPSLSFFADVSGRFRAGAHAGVRIVGGVLLLERGVSPHGDVNPEPLRGHDRQVRAQPLQSGESVPPQSQCLFALLSRMAFYFLIS